MTEPAIVLVGAGNIAKSMHIPLLRDSRANVVHAVDPSNESLKYAKSQFQRVTVSKDLSMIPREVNCAIIASPTAFHFEQTKAMLEQDIHVLCEKPLAPTERQATELVTLAEKKNLVLQVGYFRRYHPSAKAVRHILDKDSNCIPQTCMMYGGGPVRTTDMPWSFFDPNLSCGGVLMDFGVHLLDRLQSWFKDIRLVRYSDDFAGGVEANACIDMLAYSPSGGTLPQKETPIRIQLSRTNEVGNYTCLHFNEFDIQIEHNVGHTMRLVNPKKQILAGREIELYNDLQMGDEVPTQTYFDDQWREFRARMNGEPERTCSLSDAVRVSALAEQCYAKRGKLEATWEREVWGGFI